MNNNIVEFLNSKDKVELSSQVVELSALGDLKNDSNRIFKAVEDVSRLLSNLVDVKNKLRQASGVINTNAKALEKSKDNLVQATKELGIPVSSFEEYKLAIDAINAAGKAQMEIENNTK